MLKIKRYDYPTVENLHMYLLVLRIPRPNIDGPAFSNSELRLVVETWS